MNVRQYVSVEEVQSVCEQLGIRDWTIPNASEVTILEAETILKEINVEAMPITAAAFRQGLEVELEHGTRFPDANVTNNHPLLTGMIVMAHLKESMEYYLRLDIAELEGDLLKGVAAKKSPEKLLLNYRKLAAARSALADAESRCLQEHG